MAEFASAIIGIVAFGLEATHKIYALVQSIRDAPEDVRALQDEASEVGVILLEIQQAYYTGRIQLPLSSAFSPQRVMCRAKMLLDSVKEFARSVSRAGSDGGVSISPIKWLLKEGRCRKLRNELEAFKSSLNTILLIAIGQGTATSLERMMHTQGTLMQQHQRWCSIQRRQFERFQVEVFQLLQSRTENQGRSFEALSSSHKTRIGDCRLVGQTNIDQRCSDADTTGLASLSSLGRRSLRQSLSSSSPGPAVSLSQNADDSLGYATAYGQQRLECLQDCYCRCHGLCFVNILPRWLSKHIGNLYIPQGLLSVLWASLEDCNVQTCRRTRYIASHIKYFLPTWFISVEFKIHVGRSPIHLSIQTPRVVPGKSEIFQYVKTGNFAGIRALLQSGRASINDVDESGKGLLHYAVDYRNAATTRATATKLLVFLIESGAHLEWENFRHESAIDWILQNDAQEHDRSGENMCFNWRLTSLHLDVVRPLLRRDAEDYAEDYAEKFGRNQPEIYKVLLGISSQPGSVQDIIKSRPISELNEADSRNLRPLEVAAAFFPHFVPVLLESGANPHEGMPLSCAAWFGNTPAIAPLVHAGLNMNERNSDGFTPLHCAVFNGEYSSVEELVKLSGESLDWNMTNFQGETALQLAQRRSARCPETSAQWDDVLKLLTLKQVPQRDDDGEMYWDISQGVDIGACPYRGTSREDECSDDSDSEVFYDAMEILDSDEDDFDE